MEFGMLWLAAQPKPVFVSTSAPLKNSAIMAPPRLLDLAPATKIFVNREEPKRIFEKAALTIPNDRSILSVFYGIGGQGKTALCRELMRMSDPKVEPAFGFLRRALLDLKGKPKTDPDLLLVWIRNAFGRAGLATPCFDIALAIVWEATRPEEAFPTIVNPWLGRTTDRAKGAVDEDASSNATKLVSEAIGEIPFIGFALRRIGHWAIDKGKRAYLEHTRQHIQRLYEGGDLRPAYELSKELPWMLAQDLNQHLADNPTERFALFIDEYERVFDEGGAGKRWADNPFDQHMRDFIAETNGLLAVFFSRERLPWSDDPNWREELADTQHLLDGLSDQEAEILLKAVPIPDRALRAAIVNAARERPDPQAAIYPLLLDLLIQHWQVLTAKKAVTPDAFDLKAESFAGRCREIVNSVLRDYGTGLQTTIERLSFTSRFDKATFAFVVQEFGTATPLDYFDRLADLSFLSRDEAGFLSLHNVVAAAIRETLNPEIRDQSIKRLFEHFWSRAAAKTHLDLDARKISAFMEAAYLRQYFDPDHYIYWLNDETNILDAGALFKPNLALWRDALSFSEARNGSDHILTGLSLNNLGRLLLALGDCPAAKPLFERALDISEKCEGPDDPSTGACLNNLANLLQAMGDYRGAKPLFERALDISERSEGPHNPTTGERMNNLAALLRAEGDYPAAKPLFERALAISEKYEGPDHPSTARGLDNLALLLKDMGDYPGAEPLFKRALAIREKSSGPEHPSTATSLNNLAGLLQVMGKHKDARPLFERALEISEKAEGPDHPSTGASLNNLALLLKEMADYSGAKPLFERALEISEKTEGSYHPATAKCLNNLALLLQDIGEYLCAQPLFERALGINERFLGPKHPSTATILNNLGRLHHDIGNYHSAKPLLERALDISERYEGPEHPSTARGLNSLGLVLKDMGDHSGAKPLFERALAISEKFLGPEHPLTATSLNNLALLLHEQRDYLGAKPLYERALAISETSYGPEHPSTGTSLFNLASLLKAMGDYTAAKQMFERALDISEKSEGSDHPTTGRYLNSLAGLLRAMGDHLGAKLLVQRAIAVSERSNGTDHPMTGKFLENLAILLQETGDHAAAHPLLERARAIKQANQR